MARAKIIFPYTQANVMTFVANVIPAVYFRVAIRVQSSQILIEILECAL
jgi:hypothetical protein